MLVILLLMQPSNLLPLFAQKQLFTQIETIFLQDPQVPYPRASPQPGKSQTMLQFWIMISQVEQWQQLALVELHKGLVSTLFQPV